MLKFLVYIYMQVEFTLNLKEIFVAYLFGSMFFEQQINK